MVKQAAFFQQLAGKTSAQQTEYLQGLLKKNGVQTIDNLYDSGVIEGRKPKASTVQLLQSITNGSGYEELANVAQYKTAQSKLGGTAKIMPTTNPPELSTTQQLLQELDDILPTLDTDDEEVPRKKKYATREEEFEQKVKEVQELANEYKKKADSGIERYVDFRTEMREGAKEMEDFEVKELTPEQKKIADTRKKMTEKQQEMEVDATGKPLVELDKRKRENTATASSSKKQEMDPVRAELFRYLKEKYPKLNEADIYRYIVEENVSPRGIVDALEKAYMDNVDDDTPIDVEADKEFIDKVVAENPERMKGATETKQYRDFMKPEKRTVIKANRKKARSAEAVQEMQKKDRAQVVDEKRKGKIEDWLAGQIDSEELYDSTVPAEKRGAKFSTKKQGKASQRGRAVANKRRRAARLKKIEELREKADSGDVADEDLFDEMDVLLDEFFEEDSGESAPKPQTVPESDPYYDVLRQYAKDNGYSKEQYDDLLLEVQTNSASRANYDAYRSEAPEAPPFVNNPLDTNAVRSASTQAEQTPDPVKAGAQPVELAPTKAELIPKERLSVEGKSPQELLADIMYFFKNFAPQLKPIKAKWDKLPRQQKSNEAVLKRYHGEIVGRLQPEGSKAGEGKEGKVGIVVDAEQYIENKMREIMLDSRFANMQPAELVDVNEGIKKKQASDMGAFEVRQGLRGGKSFIQREPVYKAISTSQPDQLAVQMRPAGKATQPKRLSLMPAKQINLATTARAFTNANPFARSIPTITLKVLK